VINYLIDCLHFLTSGFIATPQDYRETEKMPSNLFSALQGLIAAIEITHDAEKYRKFNPRDNANLVSSKMKHESLSSVQNTLLAVLKMADAQPDDADKIYHASIDSISKAEAILYKNFFEFDGHPGSVGANYEILRYNLNRIYSIKTTKFISAGYSLMDGMLALVAALAAAADWPRETADSAGAAYTVVVAFLFMYLALLIRDIEDPLRYASVEIQFLHLLQECDHMPL
jgi:hypothetical protein